MIFVDDRTEAQKKTHTLIWLMTDRFLSDWGHAQDGPSYAGWACHHDDEYAVERWVRSRGDAKRVRLVGGNYRPPAGPGHCHIYVVGEDHSSVKTLFHASRESTT